MRFKCPHCSAPIGHLGYNVGLTEYGSYSLPEDIGDCDPEDVYNGDHDCNTTDDYGEYYYECPECGDEIHLSDLQHQAEEYDSDEESEERPVREENTEDPTSTRIVIEQKFVSSCTGNKGRTVFCPKCLHESIIDPEEVLTECPNCGKPITNK